MDVLKVPHENLKEGHIVFKNLVTSNFMMRKEAETQAQQLVAEMAANGSYTDGEEDEKLTARQKKEKRKRNAKNQKLKEQLVQVQAERPEEPEVPIARASPFRKSSNINFFVSDARQCTVDEHRGVIGEVSPGMQMFRAQEMALDAASPRRHQAQQPAGAGEHVNQAFLELIGVPDASKTKNTKQVDIVKERNIQFAIAKKYKEQLNQSLAHDKEREAKLARERARANRRKARQISTRQMYQRQQDPMINSMPPPAVEKPKTVIFSKNAHTGDHLRNDSSKYDSGSQQLYSNELFKGPKAQADWMEGKGRYIDPEVYPEGFDFSIISKIEVTPLGVLQDYNNMAHERLLVDPEQFVNKRSSMDAHAGDPTQLENSSLQMSQKVHIYNQQQLDRFMQRRCASQRPQPRLNQTQHARFASIDQEYAKMTRLKAKVAPFKCKTSEFKKMENRNNFHNRTEDVFEVGEKLSTSRNYYHDKNRFLNKASNNIDNLFDVKAKTINANPIRMFQEQLQTLQYKQTGVLQESTYRQHIQNSLTSTSREMAPVKKERAQKDQVLVPNYGARLSPSSIKVKSAMGMHEDAVDFLADSIKHELLLGLTNKHSESQKRGSKQMQQLELANMQFFDSLNFDATQISKAYQTQTSQIVDQSLFNSSRFKAAENGGARKSMTKRNSFLQTLNNQREHLSIPRRSRKERELELDAEQRLPTESPLSEPRINMTSEQLGLSMLLSTGDEKDEQDKVKSELQPRAKEISKNVTFSRQNELIVPIAGSERADQVDSKLFSDSERLRPRPGIFEVLSKKVKQSPKPNLKGQQLPKIDNVNLEKSLLIPVEVQYGTERSKDKLQDVQLKDLVAEALTIDDEDHQEPLVTSQFAQDSNINSQPRSTEQVDSVKKEEEIISQFSDGANRLHQGDSKFEPAEDQQLRDNDTMGMLNSQQLSEHGTKNRMREESLRQVNVWPRIMGMDSSQIEEQMHLDNELVFIQTTQQASANQSLKSQQTKSEKEMTNVNEIGNTTRQTEYQDQPLLNQVESKEGSKGKRTVSHDKSAAAAGQKRARSRTEAVVHLRTSKQQVKQMNVNVAVNNQQQSPLTHSQKKSSQCSPTQRKNERNFQVEINKTKGGKESGQGARGSLNVNLPNAKASNYMQGVQSSTRAAQQIDSQQSKNKYLANKPETMPRTRSPKSRERQLQASFRISSKRTSVFKMNQGQMVLEDSDPGEKINMQQANHTTQHSKLSSIKIKGHDEEFRPAATRGSRGFSNSPRFAVLVNNAPDYTPTQVLPDSTDPFVISEHFRQLEKQKQMRKHTYRQGENDEVIQESVRESQAASPTHNSVIGHEQSRMSNPADVALSPRGFQRGGKFRSQARKTAPSSTLAGTHTQPQSPTGGANHHLGVTGNNLFNLQAYGVSIVNANHLLPRQTPTAAHADEQRTERTHMKQDNRANLKSIMFKSKLKSKESPPATLKQKELELLSGSGDTKSLERVNGPKLAQGGDVLNARRRPAQAIFTNKAVDYV